VCLFDVSAANLKNAQFVGGSLQTAKTPYGQLTLILFSRRSAAKDALT
jgi:hypothetical protein